MAPRFFVIAILLSVAALVQAQSEKIGTLVDGDPSAIQSEGPRYRFRADFNCDGIPDIAISCDRREFGKMGGSFGLYLGTRNGKWRYVGSFTAHPLAVNIKRRRDGEGILTVYLRSSGTAGGLEHYSVTARGLKELPGKEIHPGDGGTDDGRAEYAKYFDDAVRLQPELSETIHGKIQWTHYDR